MVVAAVIGAAATIIASQPRNQIDASQALQAELANDSTPPLVDAHTTADIVCDGTAMRLAINPGHSASLNESGACVLLLRVLDGSIYSPEGFPIYGPFEPSDWAFKGQLDLHPRSGSDGALIEYVLCLTANMDKVSDSSGCQSTGPGRPRY